MTTTNKATLKQIHAGQYFVDQYPTGATAYKRGATRWASYQLRDGVECFYSTRHDGRTRFNVFDTKQEALNFVSAYNKNCEERAMATEKAILETR